LIFIRRIEKTAPPSDSVLPPRDGGGRSVEWLLQRKIGRTLFKELCRPFVVAAFVSLHGSAAAKRKAATQRRAWFERPCSKLQKRALFMEMHDLIFPACTAACHQRDTTRRTRVMAQQIWPPGSAVLLLKATWAFSKQVLDLKLPPAPSLCCLCTASPARGALVRPGDLEEKTRGEGFERELGGRERSHLVTISG
jgi:hypothetical protein